MEPHYHRLDNDGLEYDLLNDGTFNYGTMQDMGSSPNQVSSSASGIDTDSHIVELCSLNSQFDIKGVFDNERGRNGTTLSSDEDGSESDEAIRDGSEPFSSKAETTQADMEVHLQALISHPTDPVGKVLQRYPKLYLNIFRFRF